jgi:hypothetical protein
MILEILGKNFQKVTDDIIFQGGILTMQLGIEAAWQLAMSTSAPDFHRLDLRHARHTKKTLSLIMRMSVFTYSLLNIRNPGII